MLAWVSQRQLEEQIRIKRERAVVEAVRHTHTPTSRSAPVDLEGEDSEDEETPLAQRTSQAPPTATTPNGTPFILI